GGDRRVRRQYFSPPANRAPSLSHLASLVDMSVAARASSDRWQATSRQSGVLLRACRRLCEPLRLRPRRVLESRELHRGKSDPHRLSEPTWRCVRIAAPPPHPRDRGSVCSMTAGQHAAFVSLPVRRFPSPPRQRNSVGAEAPSCFNCMPGRHAQARNIVFHKDAWATRHFPNKGKENMSNTIEQIAAVAAFDPISVVNPKEIDSQATFSQVGAGGVSVRQLFERQKAYFASDVTKSYEWRVEQLDRLTR